MNAGASATGQAFAIRNCDVLFSTMSRGISFEETSRHVRGVRALAHVYAVGSSPAVPRHGRRRTITGTLSSTMQIGRQWTTF
jgi:hypothetical protein